MELVVLGAGLGVFVAMQPGPMSLYVLRSSVTGGWTTGAAIGAGIALVDTAYAALGAAGAGALLAVEAVRTLGGLLGAAALVLLGLLTLRSVGTVGGQGDGRELASSPRRAFAIAVGATAANPPTIASWAAIFAAAGTAASVDEVREGTQLVVGVGLGSAAWFAVLVVVASVAGRRVGRRTLQVVDVASGLGLVAFGVALGLRVS